MRNGPRHEDIHKQGRRSSGPLAYLEIHMFRVFHLMSMQYKGAGVMNTAQRKCNAGGAYFFQHAHVLSHTGEGNHPSF